MAVYVKTNNPRDLLQQIIEYINKGKIETWSVDSDGDFTHNPDQWNKKAWLRPYIEQERLVFGLIGNSNVPMTNNLYSVYHGRFIEMLLTHFATIINVTWPSSQKTTYDYFS